jgi:phospholipid transport system substrate-binding protein
MNSTLSFPKARAASNPFGRGWCCGRLRALPVFFALVGGLAMLIGAVRISERTAFADTGATEVTRTMVDQSLHILRDTATPLPQRRRQLREVIEPSFDFTEMSRSALGFHWRSLSPQQRAEFTKLFTAFIEDAYLSKIQDYSGQQVAFLKETTLDPGYVQVETKIVQGGKNPIPVNYLLESKDSTWKIYDVTVDNISIINNYRNQFNRVLNQQGFDKLMADLRVKQQELATLLDGSR